jgi:hypothetical protein
LAKVILRSRNRASDVVMLPSSSGHGSACITETGGARLF